MESRHLGPAPVPHKPTASPKLATAPAWGEAATALEVCRMSLPFPAGTGQNGRPGLTFSLAHPRIEALF